MAVADHHSAAGGKGDEMNKANLHTAEMLFRLQTASNRSASLFMERNEMLVLV